MVKAEYECPQCEGTLEGRDGSIACSECGLDISEALAHVDNRDGPLSDVAHQLQVKLQKELLDEGERLFEPPESKISDEEPVVGTDEPEGIEWQHDK